METYCKIPLCKVNVNIWTGCEMQVFNISDSFFYRSLLHDDRSIYEKYRNLVHSTWPRLLRDKKKGRVSKRKLPICSYEDFCNMYESINIKGYDTKKPMTIKKQKDFYLILDGHHRASILLHKNYNQILCIEDNKAVPKIS